MFLPGLVVSEHLFIQRDGQQRLVNESRSVRADRRLRHHKLGSRQ